MAGDRMLSISRRAAVGAAVGGSLAWRERLYGREKAAAFALIGDRYHNSDYIRIGLGRTIGCEAGVSIDFCDEVKMLDAETLAGAVCQLAASEFLRERLARGALAASRQRGWDSAFEQLAGGYDLALGRSGSQASLRPHRVAA